MPALAEHQGVYARLRGLWAEFCFPSENATMQNASEALFPVYVKPQISRLYVDEQIALQEQRPADEHAITRLPFLQDCDYRRYVRAPITDESICP